MEYTVEESVIANGPNMARRNELTDFFAQPQSTQQRRYEVCRAYFLERQTDPLVPKPPPADDLALKLGVIPCRENQRRTEN